MSAQERIDRVRTRGMNDTEAIGRAISNAIHEVVTHPERAREIGYFDLYYLTRRRAELLLQVKGYSSTIS